jgi:signal transduction histidine kinase
MGVIAFAALVYVGSGGGHVWQALSPGTALPPLQDGVVSGVFVTGAACAALVTWRRHAGPMTGLIVASGLLTAAQALLVTLVALQGTPPRSTVSLTMLAVAVAGLVAVVGPLLGLHRVGHVVDDGFAIALGMGLVAAGHLLLQLPLAGPVTPVAQLTIGALLTTHVLAVGLVLRQDELSLPVTGLLIGTVLVVSLGQLLGAGGLAGTGWDAIVTLARAAVGAAWLSVAWYSLRHTLEEDRRRITSFERVLVTTTREQRERLHELRSTLAGLVNGSAMLDRPDVTPEMRERLWCSVRRELDRMERLLSGQEDSATEIDLDDALGMILDLQRLKGRQVEFHSNGDVVRARFDALAEVVNILMDNAADHGHSDRSVVEVVRRDEETVDITVTDFGRGIPEEQRPRIFDWGKHGSDSAGEGIGLNLAQRLMTEDGGSLRLAARQGVGSSFVISLPAARRSPENHIGQEDHHAWLRSG